MNFNVTLAEGIPGKNGNTILSGTGVPSASLGKNGDFYIDTTADNIYGPKTLGLWGLPTSLFGPNVISNTTATALNGILQGNGTNVVALSPTAVTALLNIFTSTLKGLVPPSGGGTTNFLRADGAWAVAGVGSVTSVGLAAPSIFTVSGSPVTGSGTLTLSYSGTALPIANGGTGQTTKLAAFNGLSPITTTGDMIYSSSGTTNARLAIGSNGQILSVAGGIPTWVPAPTVTPQTTKGDLITYSTVQTRHAVPADGGMIIADADQTDGWRNTSYKDTQGKPGKNYIQYADFENQALDGWTLGKIGTLTNGLPTGNPTFGSGTSGVLLNINTGNPLSGTASLQETWSGASAVGDMVASNAFTIDSSDQTKILSIRFNYSVLSGAVNVNMSGTSSNSLAVGFWDLTNTKFIPVTGAFNFIQSSGVGNYTGSIQVPFNTVSMRLCVYAANATAGAVTMLYDDFYVGPDPGFQSTPSVSFSAQKATPTGTISNTFNKVTFPSASVVIDTSGSYNAPTFIVPASGEYFVSAGLSYSITGVSNGESIVAIYQNGALKYKGDTLSSIGLSASYPTVSGILTCKAGDTIEIYSLNNNTSPSFYAGNEGNYFNILKIGGSANSDGGQVVAGKIVPTSAGILGTPTTTPTNLPFNSIVSDTNGGFNTSTGLYTIKSSGYYDITGIVQYSGTATVGATVVSRIFNVTTSSELAICNFTLPAASITQAIPCTATAVYLIAGQQISVQGFYTGTFSGASYGGATSFAIHKVQGPSSQGATPSVYASYSASGQTDSIVGNTPTLIKYATKQIDTNNSYSTSTGLYTVRVPGEYEVSGQISLSTGVITLNTAAAGLSLYLNGSPYRPMAVLRAQAAATFSPIVNGRAMVYCNSGDTLSVYGIITATNTLDGSSGVGTNNYIEIKKVG